MAEKTVWPAPWSMENHYYSCNLPPQTPHALTAMVANTASDGMEKMATALSINAPMNTPAPSAVTRHTTPSPAPPFSDFLIIVTPFITDAWECELLSYSLLDTFSDIPYSIHHGFDLGIHSIPSHTYIIIHQLHNIHMKLEHISTLNCPRADTPTHFPLLASNY